MFSITSRSRIVAISISFLSLLLSSGTLPGVAQINNLPDVGLPGRRVGGGTRGPCLSDPQSFAAITPLTNVGKTIAETPTFSIYLPSNAAQAVEIGLEDENGNPFYPPLILQNVKSGIAEFSFPQGPNYPPLEVGKNYKWYVQLICDLEAGSRDAYIEGWVQRIEPSEELKQRLQGVAPREQAAIYAQENLWYDRLKTLIALRRSQPGDFSLTADWVNLLQEVKLGHLAQEPSGALR